MKRTILVFAGLAVAMAALFQLSKLSVNTALIHNNITREIFLIVSACLFVGIGIILSRLFRRQKQAGVLPGSMEIDNQALKRSGLSAREHEILVQMAKGLSNKEIAMALFISENTVKTHVSNILSKLDARRRTQAVQVARDMQIII